MSTITGFIDCDECGGEHAPVSSKCPWKIEKDAAFVLDASGTAVTPAMLENFIYRLKAMRGDRPEPFRRVLPEAQYKALIRCGWNLTVEGEIAERARLAASDEWVIDNTLPPDMLLVEWPDMFGVIKKLAVPEDE